jgi:hypothetical protein
MAQQDGALIFALVDGRECDQLTSISIKTDGGKIPIWTLKTGLSGFSPGPGKCEFSLGYSVKVGGFEDNFQKMVAEPGAHSIQANVGPHSLLVVGEFLTDSLGQSVNNPIEGSVDFMGEKKAFSDAL